MSNDNKDEAYLMIKALKNDNSVDAKQHLENALKEKVAKRIKTVLDL